MTHRFSIPLSLLSILLWSCEKDRPTALDTSVSLPYLQSASVVSQHFNLEDTANRSITKLSDGTFSIADSLTVRATDPDGSRDLKESIFRVYLPNSGTPVLVRALDRISGVPRTGSIDTVVYAARFSFVVDSSITGVYRLEAFVKDQANSISNSIVLPLVVTLNNRPPHVDVPALRYSVPPGSDSAIFTFSVYVSDPDGIEDISSVILRPLFTADTSHQLLYDDGLQSHVDRVAGDGIFSTQFRLDTASLASVEFEISATDKEGSPSNVVIKNLRNHAPEITSLTVPDSIQRPSSGFRAIGFYVSVADSEGLSDIDSVYFQNDSSANPTKKFSMYDDGDPIHGDVTAHDGIYSLIVSIDNTNTLGRKEFHFYVVDKVGYRDERIKYITIYQ